MATRAHRSRSTAAQLTLTNLDKVLYPAVGFTKAEVIDYYARGRAHDARPTPPVGASRSAATRTASTASRSSRSAARRTAPSGSPVAIGPGDRNGDGRVLPARGAGRAGVVGQPRGARAPRPDGARRRPREPADVRVRPRPRARDRHPRVRRRWRSRSATCSAAVGPRVARQDVGLEGHAALRPAQLHGPTPHPRPRRPVRPGRRPAAREAPPRRASPPRWRRSSGPARSSSTGARTPGSRRRSAPTRCGPGEHPTVSTPVTWDEVSDAADGSIPLRFEAARRARPHRRATATSSPMPSTSNSTFPVPGRPDRRSGAVRARSVPAYCWACWACSAWERAASAAASALACCLACRAMADSTIVFNSAPFGHPA